MMNNVGELSNIAKVLDALQDGVFITNGKGLALSINKAYERITGLQRHRIIGKHVSQLVADGLISRSVSLEVIRERRPVTLQQTIMGDRKILVSGNPMFNEAGELDYVVLNVRDVTELLQAKHAQEQLEDILNRVEHYNEENKITDAPDGLVHSRATRACYGIAEKAAKTDVKVLIQGETGTGKTRLAKFIHKQSLRANKPFIALNCAAMPEGLIEAELFGYVAGAFTGASSKGKAGLLEVANDGTLFLDEIGDLPLSLQAKLLKVIEDNKYLPIGGTKQKSTNVRLITATHHDLRQAIDKGHFRQDLYFRINVLPIELPALRYRTEEIPSLLQHYLGYFSQQYDCEYQLSEEALEWLTHYDWPGNIRELINTAERLVVTSPEKIIKAQDLPEEMRALQAIGDDQMGITLKQQVQGLEQRLIETALHNHKTTRAAAAALGITQSTLVKKRQAYQANFKAS
ncbi:sigma-54 interaction domain-containing protein [Glaciecola sp. 1036]|uniref:sigma-54 interaction domain-containing protein n=1 Tax=Alteromonadaceae TaxID=72275 RepID=UPI003D00B46B